MPSSKLLRLLAVLAVLLAPLPAWATFPQGVDFRGTLAFVTDPTNYDKEQGGSSSGQGAAANYPRTSAQGNTVGWETLWNFVDRSASVDARLAGDNYIASGGSATYRIDLPATGTYAIQGAFGDASFAQSTFTIQLEDGTTVFATPVNAQSITAGQFYAANGTLETSAANWATNNPNAGSGADEITHTFTTTIFRVVLTGNTGAAVMNSIFIRSTGGGPTCPKTLALMGVGC